MRSFLKSQCDGSVSSFSFEEMSFEKKASEKSKNSKEKLFGGWSKSIKQ